MPMFSIAPRPHVLGRLAAVLPAAVLLATGVAPGVPAARAAATATITGHVVDQLGHPVAGIEMTTYPDAGGRSHATTTSATGAFRLTGLTPGRTVLFSDDPTLGHLTRWWNGTTTSTYYASTFELPAGTTSIEFTDPEERRIEATALDPSGQPIPEISYHVQVRGADGPWQDVTPAVVDQPGHFVFYTSVGKRYRFCFEDDYYGEGSQDRTERYADQCWRTADSIEHATPIRVTDDTAYDQSYTLTLADAGRSMSPTVPFVYGKPDVGHTVHVDTGRWLPAGTTYTYQWYSGYAADRHPIPGATGSSYRVQGVAADQVLGVTVTGSAPGYKTAFVSDPDDVGPVSSGRPDVTTSHPLRIIGSGLVGSELSADPGVETPAADYHTFVWLVGGRVVPQSEALSTYTPTAADVGKVVTLRYTSRGDTTGRYGDFRQLAKGARVHS